MKTDVFHAYDVRGIYPDEINEEISYKIGKAFAEYLYEEYSLKKRLTVVIGRDMRSSSGPLFDSLSNGMTERGIDIIDVGVCTTPMIGFSVINDDLDGGVVISASHSSSEYNGLKFLKKKAFQLGEGLGLEKIKKNFQKNDFKNVGFARGKISKRDVLNDYLEHLGKFGKNIKDLKIVVDYGNGIGAVSGKPFFESLDIEVVSMYEKPDDSFPNHFADPHDLKNLLDLENKVKEEQADLGIFFDGDADRSVLVDENGDFIPMDLWVSFLAENELKGKPSRENIYYDLRFSRSLADVVEKNGGTPVIMRVGNPFYKAKLIEDGGIMAAELSGHVMFKENFCLDDGLFAAVKTMSMLCRKDKKISELLKPYKKYFTSDEMSFKVSGDVDAVLEKVKEAFRDGENVELDGIYIKYDDWWFNLRKSNTEPKVRLRLEADTEKKLDEMKKKLVNLIQK
ncbi:MAG: hypothetical protein ACD_63C00091G0015 [uncultured bacterium]|nr:MAG: hypothetical protein ACD_63C00091G0015 [uncultured bacterium]